VVSVTGVFRERAERNSMLRAFQRVFVIVPSSAGLCIVNEQLHVTSATSEQIKSAFKGSITFVSKHVYEVP
jgi:nuclear RNA export factor